MSNYVKDYQTHVDTGNTLEATVSSVYKNMYGWMASALGLSSLTSYLLFNKIVSDSDFAEVFLSRGVMFGLAIASVLLVLYLSARIQHMSTTKATIVFALYSVLMGAMLTPLALVYTASSIASTFVITAGMFIGMAAYGHFTKRDLSKIGNIAIMGLWGIILASIVNFFLGSSLMQYIISWVGIAVFCGLTMYDVQKFKEIIYSYGTSAGNQVQKLALMGALSLYLDFVNLFIYLLQIFGKKR